MQIRILDKLDASPNLDPGSIAQEPFPDLVEANTLFDHKVAHQPQGGASETGKARHQFPSPAGQSGGDTMRGDLASHWPPHSAVRWTGHKS